MSNIIQGQYIPEVKFDGSVQMPEWVKGKDGYTPKKGLDYWTDEELQAAYDYLVEKVATINWDDINIDMSDVIAELKQELAAVAFSNNYNDLDNKPVIPSTTGLASEEYVNNAISNIDLSNYVLASSLAKVAKSGRYSDLTGVPTNVSQFANDKGYLTQHQSLVGYAKKSDIPDVSKFLTKIPEEYVTEQELESKGYLTQHQSLAGLASEEFVRSEIANIPQIDLSGYARTEDIPSLEGYATEEYVNAKIADTVTGGEIDLSNYATVEWVNQEGYAKAADLSTVATSGNYTDLNNTPDLSIYLVAQDLENYYTKNQLYTQEEVNALISAIPKFSVKVEEVRPAEGNENTVYLIPSTDVDTDNMYVEYIYINNTWEKLGVQKFDLTGYATVEWVQQQGYLTEHQSLDGYAKITDISGFQTADQVQAAITTALSAIGIAEEGEY